MFLKGQWDAAKKEGNHQGKLGWNRLNKDMTLSILKHP